MVKRKRFLSVFLTLMIIVACGDLHAANTTVITLKGNVKASPCVVDNATQTVELGDYYMDSTSTYTSWVNLELKLSSCPSGTSTVTATFSGTAGIDATYFYANAGTAKGVNIEFADRNGNGKGNGKQMAASVTAGGAEFQLRSRIAVTDRSALAVGTVNAAVTATFTYS